VSEQIRPAVLAGIDDDLLPDPLPGGSSGAPCEAPAGFPQIAAVAVTQILANATSHVVNLPAGIAPGQLLLLISGLDGVPTISATGWTALTGASNTVAVRGLWRIADGTEGSTVTVTSSASEKAEYWVARITGAHASAAPEHTAAATGSAVANVIKPAALTPTWGAANTLWLDVAVWDLSSSAGILSVSQPIRYIYLHEGSTAATDGAGLSIFQKWLNQATETLITEIEISASEQNSGMLVAVRPA